MATMAGHWALKGLRELGARGPHSGEVVGRAGPYEPAGWPGLEIGWTVGPRSLGEGLCAGGRARAACAGRTTCSARDHIVEPDRTPPTRSSIRVAEKLGETLEGRHSATRGFDLLVYGADLPLGGSRA